jgi:hypothetical protein
MPLRSKRQARFLLSMLFAVSLLWATASGVRAAPPIEGVWSFNGGRIAIQDAQPGLFTGTVVAPTTFSLCTHPVGEEIWTQMAEQPDGSYWGLHQWFFETSECVRNPALGQTAWRVLQSAGGRYLRACFSEPGSGLQPTIAPDGAVSNATFGCVDSSLVSAVPDFSSAHLSRYVSLPASKSCLGRRKLRIHIHDPKNDPIETVVVTLSGGGVSRKAKVKQEENGAVAVANLGRFPAGVVTVKVQLTTVLGQHLSSKRRYRRCAAGKHRRKNGAGNGVGRGL